MNNNSNDPNSVFLFVFVLLYVCVSVSVMVMDFVRRARQPTDNGNFCTSIFGHLNLFIPMR